MQNNLMIQTMAVAAERERKMADAARDMMIREAVMGGRDTGEGTSAHYVIGRALVRAGRFLRGDQAARSEPVG
jgi:hypothetical protein